MLCYVLLGCQITSDSPFRIFHKLFDVFRLLMKCVHALKDRVCLDGIKRNSCNFRSSQHCELWQFRCMWLTAGAIFVPCSQVAHVILYPDSDKMLVFIQGNQSKLCL